MNQTEYTGKKAQKVYRLFFPSKRDSEKVKKLIFTEIGFIVKKEEGNRSKGLFSDYEE